MNEQKIQIMPTTTQPVKNCLENIYPVPYKGMGHRIRKKRVLKSYICVRSVIKRKARKECEH